MLMYILNTARNSAQYNQWEDYCSSLAWCQRMPSSLPKDLPTRAFQECNDAIQHPLENLSIVFFFPRCLVSLPSVWTKVATQVEGLSWGQEHLWSSMLLNCGGYWSLLPEWDRSRNEPANKERMDNGLDGCRKHSWYTDDLHSTTNVKIL
jgi:hypothetical protein